MTSELSRLEEFLENEAVVDDLSRVVGSLELEEGFVGEPVEKEKALDRPDWNGRVGKLTATGFEQLAAHNYGGEFIDNCADVRIGLNDDLPGFPVQVKSCLLFRKDGGTGQRANFVVRHNSYSKLPENALMELNLYSPVDSPEASNRTTYGFKPDEYQGIEEFNAAEFEGQIFQEENPEDNMLYLDLHRRVLIPKNLFEETVRRYDETDLSLTPEHENSSWYERKEYNVPWIKIFGKQRTPIEESPIRETARKIYPNTENPKITNY